MESKAQKAAYADVEKEKIQLINLVNEFGEGSGDIVKHIIRIEQIIKEYGLEDKLFSKVVNEIYDALMVREAYSKAASIAKRYGL